MPLHVSSTCAHNQEVKIALHSLWYHYTYRWPSRAQVERILSQPVYEKATYRCDDTRGCVMQFWLPDYEHMCSKHVEAWNKLIVKQKFCASSWLITELNILRCKVRKTSKNNVTVSQFTSRPLKTTLYAGHYYKSTVYVTKNNRTEAINKTLKPSIHLDNLKKTTDSCRDCRFWRNIWKNTFSRNKASSISIVRGWGVLFINH